MNVLQGNNFNPFYGFGPMAGVANMQAPSMQQVQGGYPWNTNFQNMQSQQQMQAQRMDANRQQPQQVQNDFFVLVNGVEDVKNTLLQPNQSMWFRFQNDPYIAYKFANEVGTADTKYFEIREVDPAVFSSGGFNRGGQDRQQEFVAYIQAIEQKVSSLEAQLKEIKEMKGVTEDVKSIKQVPQQSDAKPASRK